MRQQNSRPLSILVPACNCGPWIRQTLESLAAQQTPDLEILVIDYGSTDETTEIVAEFATHDPRFRLISVEALGPGGALNAGLDAASGSLLMFGQGSDLMPVGAIDRVLEIASKESVDAILGRALEFTPTQTRPTGAGARPQSGEEPEIALTWSEVHDPMANRGLCSAAFSADAWRANGIRFDDKSPVHPWAMRPATAALLAARRVTSISDILHLHRIVPPSAGQDAAEALVAQLSEEVACHELIVKHGDQKLVDHHLAAALGGESWRRAVEYMTSADLSSGADSVTAAATAAMETFGPAILDVLPTAHAKVWQLLCSEPALAAEAHRLWIEKVDPADSPDLIARWADILAAAPLDQPLKHPSPSWVFTDVVAPRLHRLLGPQVDFTLVAEPLQRVLLSARQCGVDPLRTPQIAGLDFRLDSAVTELVSGNLAEFARRASGAARTTVTLESIRKQPGALRLIGRSDPVDFMVSGIAVIVDGQPITVAHATMNQDGRWFAEITTDLQTAAGKHRVVATGQFADHPSSESCLILRHESEPDVTTVGQLTITRRPDRRIIRLHTQRPTPTNPSRWAKVRRAMVRAKSRWRQTPNFSKSSEN